MTTQAAEGQQQGAEPPEGGGGKDDDYGKPPTMAELRGLVAETVESALKPFMDKLGGGQAPAAGKPAAASSSADAGDPSDLAGMVNDAIAKVLGDKDKQAAEDAHRAQHEQLAAAAERPPVDRPRRSRWLGAIYDN